MRLTIRQGILAAGAAALISAQAAHASPAQSLPSVDPLVALTLLSSSQSGGTACPAGMVPAGAAAAAGAAAQAAPANCVLPVTGAAGVPVGQAVPPPPMYPATAPGKAFGAVPAVLGLALLIGAAIAILSSGSGGQGNLTPISPQ